MRKEIDILTEQLVEKILTDPEARKIAEEFIRRNAAEGVA